MWSRDENHRLTQALQSCGIDYTNGDMHLPVGVSWDTIATEVKTHSALQCRAKWYGLKAIDGCGYREWLLFDMGVV